MTKYSEKKLRIWRTAVLNTFVCKIISLLLETYILNVSSIWVSRIDIYESMKDSLHLKFAFRSLLYFYQSEKCLFIRPLK